jgi:hypothetical protein
MTTDTLTRNAALHHAISLLAGACDGARAQDGVGFNSLDTKFGKRIAAIAPEHWTEEIASDASAILPIYRKQLSGYGVNVDELPLIKDASRNQVARDQARAAERKRTKAPYAVVSNGEIRVFNGYDLKDQLKTVGYGFKGWDKAWVAKVGRDAAAKVIELGIELRDGAEDIKAAASAPAERRVLGTVIYDSKADLIVIKCDKGVVPLDVMRSLPGRKWDQVNYVNTCYPEPVVLEVTERYGLDISPLAREAIESRAARVAESSAVETDAVVALSDVLRPYQAAGVAYSVKHGKSINADEMGLGKTLQAIASAETVGEFPVLITCPASLRGNWVREINRWTPWRTVAICDGHTIPDTDYVVVSYEGMTSLTKEG